MPGFPRRGFIVGFCLLSLFAIAWTSYARYGYPYDNLEFDRDTWMKEAGRSKIGVRYQMLDDLVANYLPVGMRKADVMQLLGEPTDDYETESNWTIPVSHVSDVERVVSVHFDADQRIRLVALYTE
ncbi:MAG: hypothetical protein C0483_24620 [Pirellula sp.]|nr:hypothetical protein [Pirellula sp.]